MKVILSFFFLFAVFFCGISYVWHLTHEEKMNYLKMVIYSILCSVITMFVLVGIVILF
jgi:hypothetical protein